MYILWISLPKRKYSSIFHQLNHKCYLVSNNFALFRTTPSSYAYDFNPMMKCIVWLSKYFVNRCKRWKPIIHTGGVSPQHPACEQKWAAMTECVIPRASIWEPYRSLWTDEQCSHKRWLFIRNQFLQHLLLLLDSNQQVHYCVQRIHSDALNELEEPQKITNTGSQQQQNDFDFFRINNNGKADSFFLFVIAFIDISSSLCCSFIRIQTRRRLQFFLP